MVTFPAPRRITTTPTTTLRRWREHPHAPTALAVVLSAVVLALLAFGGVFGPLATVGLIVGVAVLLAVVAQPKIGLYLAVLTVPVQDLVKAGSVTTTQLAFLLVLGAWLLGQLVRGARWGWLRDANLWRFALFYAAIFASARVATDVTLTLADAYRWGVTLAIYVIARETLRTRRDWAVLLACFCAGATGEAWIGTVQSQLGLGNPSFAVAVGLSRAFGTFGRPNSYAAYLEQTFPLALAAGAWAAAQLPAAWARWRATWRGPLAQERGAARALTGRLAVAAGIIGTGVVVGAAILLSFSRGAWLGTVAAIIVMTMLSGRRAATAMLLITVALGLFLALGGTDVLPDVLAARIESFATDIVVTNYEETPITDANFAVKERTAYWFGGLKMIRDYPLTGVGLGNFGVRYDGGYYTAPFLKSQVHAHNYYIHIAAETGLPGLLAYLLLIGGVLATGWQASKRARTDGFARALAIGGTGVVVAVAVHNVFENVHVLSMGVHLAAIWALLAAIRAAFPLRGAVPVP